MVIWPTISGVISDLDGVVYRGADSILSAVEAFQRWHRAGVPYVFVTNNSTQTAAEFAIRINGMGIEVEASQIVTSAQATALRLAGDHPQGARVFVVGAQALKDAVQAQGFALAEVGVDVVVSGLDRGFTYQTLAIAQRALLAGAAFYGTNADPMLPNDAGFDPGAGSILQAIATASGRVPVIVGKPARHMIDLGLARLGTPLGETLMIGDQIETDIVAGHAAGLTTVLVRTGVPETGPRVVEPDFVVEDLGQIGL